MNYLNADYVNSSEERIVQVTLKGSLTAMQAINFKSQLLSLIEDNNSDIHINITKLNALDLTGVNSLAMAHKRMQDSGKKLVLLSAAGHPDFEFLHLTRFMDYFEFKSA